MTSTTARKRNKPSRLDIAEQSEGPNTKRTLIIIGALLGAAAIVALIIALASGGDDEPEMGAAESARIPPEVLRQVSAASATGDPLPVYDETTVPDPAVGAAAPEITASYFDDEEVTVATDDGTPRIVLFLAHWCPHCQREVKALVPWFFDNGVPTDVEVIAISTGVDQGAPNYPPSEWFRREGWAIPVLRDSAQSDLARAYGLSSYPYIVVIDGDGNVVNRTSGELADSDWEALLDSARSPISAGS